MSIFLCRLEGKGTGPRIAIKDNIDLAGIVTTAGSKALSREAKPAVRDAACLAGARAADARFIGKTNMDELAMSALGDNPWFSNPINPLDASLIPGGSSSGSAVAVASGAVEVGIGTDTSGSIRIPAACCGIYGLKPTYSRVSTRGVQPLAPSLDVIGPLAADALGLETGMALLEPGFRMAASPAARVGRIRTAGEPDVEAAIDHALRRANLTVTTIDLDLAEGDAVATTTFFAEAEQIYCDLVARQPDAVSSRVHEIMRRAKAFRGRLEQAAKLRERWRARLAEAFADFDVLALPTIPVAIPTVAAVRTDPTVHHALLSLTAGFNAAGTPCCAQPVPVAGSALPASLQLVAPWGREDLLIRTAAEIEAAMHAGTGRWASSKT